MFEKINLIYTVLSILIIIIVGYLVYYYLVVPRFMKEKFTEGEQMTQESKNQGFEPNAELVLYYAMWCGYSKMFLPEWEKFEEYAKANLPNVKVTKIRCEDGNEAVCMQKGIEGYPSVRLYLKGGEEIPFEGDRTYKKLVEFISKYAH